jgi:uncharacterized Zn finger protein
MPSPTLTRADVRAWTDDRFYERGARYARQDRIRHLRRTGDTLKAECIGSMPMPYRVEVTLTPDGPGRARCTCPVDSPRCKHVVALLLTWIDAPEDVPTVSSLEDTLRAQPADKLVNLVLKLLDRHPDLDGLVRTLIQPHDAFDADDLRQRIRDVFPSPSDPSYGSGYDEYGPVSERVAQDLRPFLDLADDLAEQEHTEEAIETLRLVIDETCEHYETMPDVDGDLGIVLDDASQRLGQIMEDLADESLRDGILRTLYDLYVLDLRMGGIDIGYTAGTILANDTTPEERERVADWVRQRMERARARAEKASHSGRRWHQNWQREALGGFLLKLGDVDVDDETYLDICRASGRLDDLVTRLLELGRTDDAVEALREDASDYDLVNLAPTFAEHDAAEALRALADARLSDDSDRRLVAWLRDQAREAGDLDRALDLTRRLFWERSTYHADTDTYEELREIARTLGCWDDERGLVHDHYRRKSSHADLARLHLIDGDVDAALESLQQVSGHPTSLRLKVARAAEDARPDDAIAIYTEEASRRIEARGRDNYQEAARHLARVKAILTEAGREDEWEGVRDEIEDVTRRLPAARDELGKADVL